MNLTMKAILLLFLVSLTLIVGCTSTTQPSTVTHKSQGQTLFEDNCTSCHGTDGKLCVLGAKDLTLSSISKEESIGIITNGKNTMTPFATILNKEEIDAVAEYVQTFKTK